MLVDLLVGSALAEGLHADEDTIRADDLVPTLPHARLDRNAHGRVADHGRAIGVILGEEKIHAGD